MKLKIKDLLDIKFYTHYNLHMNDLIEYLIIINLVSFLMYGVDKFLACKHLTRVPEVVLLFFPLIGAPIGSIIGMKLFHHKTKKIKFWLFNIIMLLIYIYIIYKMR